MTQLVPAIDRIFGQFIFFLLLYCLTLSDEMSNPWRGLCKLWGCLWRFWSCDPDVVFYKNTFSKRSHKQLCENRSLLFL